MDLSKAFDVINQDLLDLFICLFFYLFILSVKTTVQKMKFSIKDFFQKCKKSLMENFIFCAVNTCNNKISKNFYDVSTLLPGWYDVITSDNVKSTLKQRCVCQRWNLQRWPTSKHRCYFQLRVSQRWTTSKQRCKHDNLEKFKKSKKLFLKNKNLKKKKKRKLKLNTLNSKFRVTFRNLVDFISHFKRNLENNICRAAQIFMKMLHYKNYIWTVSFCKVLINL